MDPRRDEEITPEASKADRRECAWCGADIWPQGLEWLDEYDSSECPRRERHEPR